MKGGGWSKKVEKYSGLFREFGDTFPLPLWFYMVFVMPTTRSYSGGSGEGQEGWGVTYHTDEIRMKLRLSGVQSGSHLKASQFGLAHWKRELWAVSTLFSKDKQGENCCGIFLYTV